MNRKRRTDLTPAVFEKIRQEYAAGIKTIVIQADHKISPGQLYRIIHTGDKPHWRLSESWRLAMTKTPPPVTNPVPPVAEKTMAVTPTPAPAPMLLDKPAAIYQAIRDAAPELNKMTLPDTIDGLEGILVKCLQDGTGPTVKALGYAGKPCSAEDLLEACFTLLIREIVKTMPEIEILDEDTYRLKNRVPTRIALVLNAPEPAAPVPAPKPPGLHHRPRRVRCKTCGERWYAAHGKVIAFYTDHNRRHHREEPGHGPDEAELVYIQRLIKWRQTYYEDSIYPEGGANAS